VKKGCAQKRSRVVVVDDHPIVRERLIELVNRQTGLVPCGEADDRSGALQIIRAQAPDLVIVDLTLKNSDGLELIKDIHARWPKLLILVLSMHDESVYAERAIRAGARGYVNKQEPTARIVAAIRRVLEGGIYLHEKIASNLLMRMTGEQGPGHPAELLADRELQVFHLTGQGLTTRQIADRLHIGLKSVETYRARIREKLNFKNGAELLQSAISWSHQPSRNPNS
jgi:DNA-binding NarL/FixJ family response regulator